jgi:hypothetical protein
VARRRRRRRHRHATLLPLRYQRCFDVRHQDTHLPEQKGAREGANTAEAEKTRQTPKRCCHLWVEYEDISGFRVFGFLGFWVFGFLSFCVLGM